nr:outer membrane protein transport protein [Poseidonocella sedimentorum]
MASAGGIDRSGQSIGLIFEEGNYAQLSFGSVSPDVSGAQVIAVPTLAGVIPAGSESGNMSGSYTQFSLGFKQAYDNGLEMAFILDQPFGADVEYPDDETYFAAGSTAELSSTAITGIVKYSLPNNVSVFGGLRYQSLEAKAYIPFVTASAGPTAGVPYEVDGEKDWGLGYLLGVAYERPDIALRVALTYNSAIDHEIDTYETSALNPGGLDTVTDVSTPQSLNLEFQSGIAADTLLFGSVRWVDWSEFDISPQDYDALLDFSRGAGDYSLVSYDDDTTSYSLGLGRRINETWSAAVTVGYEASAGGFASNLGPTDGRTSIGLAATYTDGPMKITGGVSYVRIGDAETTLDGTSQATEFDDNSAIGWGLRIGYAF